MGKKKTCYFASKLWSTEVLFDKKKMNLDQYLNQREKGKTKQNQSSLFCMAKPFCFSL